MIMIKVQSPVQIRYEERRLTTRHHYRRVLELDDPRDLRVLCAHDPTNGHTIPSKLVIRPAEARST